MTFEELLQARRSIRQYRDRPVRPEVVQQILNASTFAPSAGNQQPCKFIIVNNRDVIKRVSDESKRNILDRIAADPDDYAQRYQKMLANPAFNVFYNAPCLILVLGEAGVKNLWVDGALAACYIMMAAAARGLGTCWVNLGAEIRSPQLKGELGIPDNGVIVAPIILGYPEGIPPAPKRKPPQVLRIIS